MSDELTLWSARSASDYQQVARSNPSKLSQAIQAGIPDVIRGQIWQLSAFGPTLLHP